MVHKSNTHVNGIGTLNGLSGDITLISSNGSVTIIAAGSTIDLTTSGGGGGSPGGSDTQFQFNDANSFGGIPNFVYDKVSGRATYGDVGGGNFVTFYEDGAIGATTGTISTGGTLLGTDVIAVGVNHGFWFDSTGFGFFNAGSGQIEVSGTGAPGNYIFNSAGFFSPITINAMGAGSSTNASLSFGNVDTGLYASSANHFSAANRGVSFLDVITDVGTGVLGFYISAIPLFVDFIYNATNAFQIEVNGATLRDSSGVTLNWGDKKLFSGGVLGFDWGQRQLIANNGSTVSLDWSDPTFVSIPTVLRTPAIYTGVINSDADDSPTIRNADRTLTTSADIHILDWSGANPLSAYYYFDSGNSFRLTGDGSGLTGIVATSAIDAKYLKDNSGFMSANGVDRQLFRNDGLTLAIDWQDLKLWGATGAAMIDWSNSTSTGFYYFASNILQGDGSGLTNLNAKVSQVFKNDLTTAVLSGENRTLSAAAGVSVDWENGYLSSTSTGFSTVNWQNQTLSLPGSPGAVALDWSGGYGSGYVQLGAAGAYFLGGIRGADGNTAINPGNGAYVLYSAGNITSVDWATRALADDTNLTSVDWNNRHLVGAGANIPLLWDDNGVYMPLGIFDASNVLSINPETRLLYASNGTTIILDWHTDTTNTFSAVYWFDSANGNRITGNGSGLTDVAVVSDGVTITGNGTSGSPLVAVGGGGGVTNVYNETPTGLIDSSNLIYTTASNFSSGKTRVYLNGLRQTLGVDYTETAANEITFTVAPTTGDTLIMDYQL